MGKPEHILAHAGGLIERDWEAVRTAEREWRGRALASSTVAESYEELRALYEAWGGPPTPDLEPLEREASAARVRALCRRCDTFARGTSPRETR